MGEATVGTVTVLFTDLVDSTRLLQLGAGAADEVRRAHFEDVGRCIDAHRGVLVKNTGDGIMATFASANDAVTAAEVIQQTVDHRRRTDPRTCAVRVGIASGEASHEGDDWFGAPVILAARLCAVAEAAGILVTALVRLLMDGRGEHRFVDRGGVRLKGFDDPVDIAELLWDRWEPPGLPAPAVSARSADRVAFVGRDDEFRRLLDRWKEAQAGRRAVVFVGGEPGMGKTRLLSELAAEVHATGGRVLWGRCDDDAVVPFQPWVEPLRQVLEADSGRQVLAAHPPLEVLLPELGEDRGPRPRRALLAPGTDGEAERLQLFDAVSAVIAELARDGPLLIVLDDLHWAARPSLLLLRHVVREGADAGMLLVASYRDNEVDRHHPLADVLADLGRDPSVARCPITGLDRSAVSDLTREVLDVGGSGPSSTASLALAVHQETRGNPFFVGQVLSHLAELGGIEDLPPDLAELGVPDGVREVIGRRLARLSDASNRALTVAAVVGAEFDLETLEAVSAASGPEADLLDALDESVGARLIEEVEGVPGRYQFAHALVRQTILADLSATRRARLHRHVADSLRQMPRPDPAVLAAHYCAGATRGRVAEALSWSAIAADAAIEGLAAERAIVILERALAVSELDPEPDRAARAVLWLLLASAHQWIGETDVAKRAADRAAAEARGADDAELLARAAVQRAGWAVAGTFDLATGDLVAEALDRLGPDRPDLRSRLLATLALHRSVNENQGLEAVPMSDEAVALARETGDPNLLSMVLGSAVVMHVAGPDLDEQRRMVEELESLAPRLDTLHDTWDNRVTAQRTQVVLDLQQGDADGSRRRALEDTGVYPGMVAIWRSMHELFAGRFPEAEEANRQLGPYIGTDMNFRNSSAGLLFRLRRDQGRIGEVLPVLTAAADRAGGLVALQTMHALALIDVGELEAARQILDGLAPDGFAAVPSDSIMSACLSDLAEIVTRMGDPELAVVLHDRLSPFAGQLLVVSWGVACLGAADRYLAMLEWVLGRHDEAEAHLAAALALEERAGGRPAAARTRLWWGELLLQRRQGDDVARARELLVAAAHQAEDLGMAGVPARAAELL